MIKANELRIGNYFEYQGKIYKASYHEIRICEIRKDNEYNPIPLTEEWLLKFGISKSKREVPSWSDYFRIGEYKFEVDNNGKPYATILQSVHQLQNLYFALTGEELEQNKILQNNIDTE